MTLSLSRLMDVDRLWEAGKEGLPILVIQGTEDQHRKDAEKNVDEMMRPHFKDYKTVWLEGRGILFQRGLLEAGGYRRR